MVQKMQTNDKKCLLKRSPLSTTGYPSTKGIARLCVAFYSTLNAKHPFKYKKIPFWNLLVWGTTEIILNLIIRLRVITGLCCLWQASRFSVICVEKLAPGGRKTRGLGLRNDVLTYYFIRFSLAWIVIFLYLAHIVHYFALCFIQYL